ncbi:MAG TPA: ion channel [Longimicrobium sp.]
MIHIIRIRVRGALLRATRSDALLFVAFLAVVLGAGAAGLRAFEEGPYGWGDALWWSYVTATSTGYGDIFPKTGGGRVAGVFLMTLGIALNGGVAALMLQAMIDRRKRRSKGMGTFSHTGHYVICHWNARGPGLIAALRDDPRARHTKVVIIAELAEHPVPEDPDVEFVRGKVAADTLARANLDGAAHILILGDGALTDWTARDAKNVLAALVIEKQNSKVHSIVELYENDNAVHCRHAQVDEVVVSSDINTGILSRSLLDPGMSAVVTDLLSPSEGQHLMSCRVPADLVGRRYIEVFHILKDRENQTLLGVHCVDAGEVLTNPPADRVLRDDDRLVVLSAS